PQSQWVTTRYAGRRIHTGIGRCRRTGMPLTNPLSQRLGCGAQLLREELRFLPRGEVTALVHLVEVDGDVGVSPLDPAARGTPDLPGERREADRNRDRRRSLACRTNALLSFFPVRARRRRPGAGQPIEREGVDDVLPGEIAREYFVDKGECDLLVGVRVVIDHPGCQVDGRI